MSKPKNAVTMIAQGLLYDVWALRGDQIGIVSRRSGEIRTIHEREWKGALGDRVADPANPTIDAVRHIDAACRRLTFRPEPAM
ncbi:hypothetical protein FE249_18595 (plasmid) [Acidiphilium multivorum]|uniref:hypothetical protein n=1 Tax=Acidiphilium TaxID=522 RepID=UPI00157ADA75|nr:MULTISPECIES: hypothetical protein [Acidiphilium]UNC16236.1 hypothetical protein FE249_18595 [Acidiphilium multivorum]